MLAVLFGIKCKKKVLAKQNNAQKSASTIGKRIFIFEVVKTKRARSNKSFILCLYMKTICAKQAKVHSSYFVQCDLHGIIAKDLT